MKTRLAAAVVTVAFGVVLAGGTIAVAGPSATFQVVSVTSAGGGHPGACQVTITSSKGISNYVVTDSHGTATKTELTTETNTIVVTVPEGSTITVKAGTTVVTLGPFFCNHAGDHLVGHGA
jgi:hypothetical protein